MADVYVTISQAEQEAAGLDTPEVVFVNADAHVRDEALLLIRRQDQILAEYPAERYVGWEVRDTDEGTPVLAVPQGQESPA